jgi:hypothetical protein
MAPHLPIDETVAAFASANLARRADRAGRRGAGIDSPLDGRRPHRRGRRRQPVDESG